MHTRPKDEWGSVPANEQEVEGVGFAESMADSVRTLSIRQGAVTQDDVPIVEGKPPS